MLYLIGLGLGDFQDITLKGLEAIRKADKVFLEAYTSILCNANHKQDLREFYGKDVIQADREMVESDDNMILNLASKCIVAFLVVGDVFGATTHTDLVLRAKERGIAYKIIHNASILTAVGCCGLQLYNFGETVSIPLWTDSWRPYSFIGKIQANLKNGLHTLCLLDIKVKEKTIEALIKGRNEYEPPRFMTVDVAAIQILELLQFITESSESSEQLTINVPQEQLADEQKENVDDLLTPNKKVVGLARVGADDQQIVYTSLSQMAKTDLGRPLHCLIIPGQLHPLEQSMLDSF